MWLLNTQTFKLEEFTDPAAVKYAILSHTWENDEVSFREISDLNSAATKAGFSKIEKTCELARQKGLRYAWVDTCCIDKSSSTELSEAINSMFHWYKLSDTCFVYLSDMPSIDGLDHVAYYPRHADPQIERILRPCKWFTRGWTLQELIAPNSIIFCNSKWQQLFTKAQIKNVLERITRISQSILDAPLDLSSIPVAVKMSWAAHRKTKRIEDQAYCLLGIFGINMPMLYGEGNQAFRRLQEEIAKETHDLSLFAWRSTDIPVENPFAQRFRGIFASSPADFSTCSTIDRRENHEDECEFSLTNKGVRIDTTFYKGNHGVYIMKLGFIDSATGTNACLSLVRTADGFVRSQPWSLRGDVDTSNPDELSLTIYVKKDIKNIADNVWLGHRMSRSFRINVELPPSLEIESMNPYPRQLWDEFFRTFNRPNPTEGLGASLNIRIKMADGERTTNYPINLTLGWSQVSDKALAVIHSTEQLSLEASSKFKTPGRHAVLNQLPEDFPTFKKDDNLSRSFATEDRLRLISENPRFNTQTVQFVDEERGGPYQTLASKKARITRFDIRLETSNDPDTPAYHINLSASVEGTDLDRALHDGSAGIVRELGPTRLPLEFSDLSISSSESELDISEATSATSFSSCSEVK
ncbi:het domain-containing protein [Colletotrichum kahawae]|uniref:Het domain-containing protein n=1 Tax=Colletotrichum kahawae TaxID=34407 RepID=A0AAD9YMI3_COLKA|nr:het domain-containing protein [Colletotrichum kahawae]